MSNTKYKIGQLINECVYLFNDVNANFRNILLENSMNDDIKRDEKVDKVMLLTTELLKK